LESRKKHDGASRTIILFKTFFRQYKRITIRRQRIVHHNSLL